MFEDCAFASADAIVAAGIDHRRGAIARVIGRVASQRSSRSFAFADLGDQLATGKRIRVLTAVGTFSRYVPVLDPRFSYCAEDVVRTLEHVCSRIGYPKTIRVDPGSEFVSRDLDVWLTPYPSRSTSAGRESPPTMPIPPISTRSTVQGPLPGGVSERPLVLTLANSAEKMEDWCRLQRGARMGRLGTRSDLVG
jgi:putative transposase